MIPKTQTKLLEDWKKWSYVLFFILIPSILILVYLLPIKQYFILNPSSPTPISIFFSNYTHSEFSHLINNLISYLIVIFLLFNIEINKKMFLKVSLLNFLLVPALSSLFIIYFLSKVPPVQGFSAVVSAFMGYLLYSIYTHLKTVYYEKLNNSFLWLLLMINFVIWSIFNKIEFSIFLILITLFLAYINREPIKEILTQIKSRWNKLISQKFLERFYNITIFIFTILFVFSLWSLIPSRIIFGSSLINTPTHYLGYCFGVFIPVLIERWIK